jgi:hypothetical protein
MNVEQIVREYLKKNGYDGLCNKNGECSCDLADLMPCGFQDTFCVAGHLSLADENEEGIEWTIAPGEKEAE